MILGAFLEHPRRSTLRTNLIKRHWRDKEEACVRLAGLLEEAFRAGDHIAARWPRFDDYAEHEFGIPPKQAWTFLFLGRRLRELPATRRALLRGRIGYTKAREFASIATPEDEEEWIAYARSHTSRELERKVRRVRRGTPDEKEHVTGWYDGLEMQLIEQAWHEAKRETGRTMALSELLPFLAQRYLEGKLPRGRRKLLGFNVMQLCPTCLDTWIPTRLGHLRTSIERFVERLMDPDTKLVNLLEEQLCDCEGRKHRADLCPKRDDLISAFPRTKASRFVRKEVLYQVWLRDGGRCRYPGCTSSGEPETCHLVPVAEGGPAEAWNLVTMCSFHNDLHEQGDFEIRWRPPFEGYFVDGKCVGVGNDPRFRGREAPEESPDPEEPLSHGGHSPPGGDGAPAA